MAFVIESVKCIKGWLDKYLETVGALVNISVPCNRQNKFSRSQSIDTTTSSSMWTTTTMNTTNYIEQVQVENPRNSMQFFFHFSITEFEKKKRNGFFFSSSELKIYNRIISIAFSMSISYDDMWVFLLHSEIRIKVSWNCPQTSTQCEKKTDFNYKEYALVVTYIHIQIRTLASHSIL